MRICIATPLLPPQPGGPARYAAELKDDCIHRGHSVSVIAFRDVLRHPSLLRHLVFFWKMIRGLGGVDAVIVLDTWSVALPTVLAARLRGVPVYLRTGGDFVWERYVEETGDLVTLPEFYRVPRTLFLKTRLIFLLQKYLILPLVNTLIFSTTWQREIWMKPYALTRTKTAIIENAYTPSVEEKNQNDDRQKIVWIGRDLKLKNVALLDEAMSALAIEYPDVVYQKYSNITPEEVEGVLRESRALVIPSLSEISPNLALEALALGIPVVLTNECGLRDVLADAVLWIDPKSVENIKAQIEVLLSPEGYRSAQERAHAFRMTRSYTDVALDFITLIESPGS